MTFLNRMVILVRNVQSCVVRKSKERIDWFSKQHLHDCINVPLTLFSHTDIKYRKYIIIISCYPYYYSIKIFCHFILSPILWLFFFLTSWPPLFLEDFITHWSTLFLGRVVVEVSSHIKCWIMQISDAWWMIFPLICIILHILSLMFNNC